MTNYKVLTGIDYEGKRAEAGQVVSDLPTKSVSWLLESGLIELADGKTKTKVEQPVVEEPIKEELKDINVELLSEDK
jgi:hypothetical protein